MGIRPCHPAAHKPKGLRGPTAPMRCADGMERDSEEGRPARAAMPSTPERGSGTVGGRLAQRRSGAETSGHQTGRRRRDGRRRIKAFRHLPESHRFCNRGNAERCFHGKGYVLRRRAPKRSKAAFGGILGPQSGRSLPIVGPPSGETARSHPFRSFPGSARENNRGKATIRINQKEKDGAASHGEPGRSCLQDQCDTECGPTIPRRAVVPEASPGNYLRIPEQLHRELAERGLRPSGASKRQVPVGPVASTSACYTPVSLLLLPVITAMEKAADPL